MDRVDVWWIVITEETGYASILKQGRADSSAYHCGGQSLR